VVLRASTWRAAWRSLHSILARSTAETQGGLGGPLTWQNIASDREFTLWTGGLHTDFRAKIEDAIESNFDIPAAMSVSATTQQLYKLGADFADDWSRVLYGTVVSYAEQLHFEPEHRRAIAGDATYIFWAWLPARLRDLFSVVTAKLAEHPEWFEGLTLLWHQTPWGDTCREAAEVAFDRACPRGTPRQMQAYSLARRWLRPPQTKQRKGKRKSTAKAREKTQTTQTP